jgi:cytochrome c-type biogenesis protein CcmH
VILFWVICIVMLGVALFFVLPPALHSEDAKAKDDNVRRNANIAVYRDQLKELEADLHNGIVSEEQYAQDRDDIERRLLDDTANNPTTTKAATRISATTRKHAYMIAVGLSLVAVIFYLRVGTPDGITNAATMTTAPSAPAATSGQPTQAQIEERVAALAQRLKENPTDAQGWVMLGRSYSSMERWGEAAGAYAKATELTPDKADLWADYAFVAAMANGRVLKGQPMELVNRALKLDPDNGKALGLAANAAFEAKEYQKAIDYWQRLAKQVPANSEVAQTIAERIDEAKLRLSGGTKQK